MVLAELSGASVPSQIRVKQKHGLTRVSLGTGLRTKKPFPGVRGPGPVHWWNWVPHTSGQGTQALPVSDTGQCAAGLPPGTTDSTEPGTLTRRVCHAGLLPPSPGQPLCPLGTRTHLCLPSSLCSLASCEVACRCLHLPLNLAFQTPHSTGPSSLVLGRTSSESRAVNGQTSLRLGGWGLEQCSAFSRLGQEAGLLPSWKAHSDPAEAWIPGVAKARRPQLLWRGWDVPGTLRMRQLGVGRQAGRLLPTPRYLRTATPRHPAARSVPAW